MRFPLYVFLSFGFFLGNSSVMAQATDAPKQPVSAPVQCSREQEEKNKITAWRFLEDVWVQGKVDEVDQFVAPTYIAHDIGDDKGVTEPADEQKKRAGSFSQNGTMKSTLGFQIAECDLVATYHEWDFQPNVWWGKLLMLGTRRPLPIINVFRIRDGKIVEMWNHRHDIDSFGGNVVLLKGVGNGLIPSLVLAVVAFVLWRKLRKQHNVATTGGASV